MQYCYKGVVKFSFIVPQVIVLLVPIPVSSSADGPSPCCVVVEAATSTRSMALKAIVAWRPHPAWLVLISVCSAGGQYPYSYPKAMVIIISCKVYMCIVTVQREICCREI